MKLARRVETKEWMSVEGSVTMSSVQRTNHCPLSMFPANLCSPDVTTDGVEPKQTLSGHAILSSAANLSSPVSGPAAAGGDKI